MREGNRGSGVRGLTHPMDDSFAMHVSHGMRHIQRNVHDQRHVAPPKLPSFRGLEAAVHHCCLHDHHITS